jgi:hypothetical protein
MSSTHSNPRPQTFDSTGECEHQVRVNRGDGTYVWVWSTIDECFFCGSGRAWK